MGFRDMDLDDQVRATLRKDPELSGYRIDVKVQNGIVYLQGQVSAHARSHAIEVAKTIETVAAVVDQMTIPA